MSPITIGKPDQDSPRPQRRHFVDPSVRTLQEKLLVHAGSVQDKHTTYTSDFVDQFGDPAVPKTTERFVRRRFNPALVPVSDLEALNKSLALDARPCQKDANKLLYKSTYQENYRQGFKPETISAIYNAEHTVKGRSEKKVESLYQESFDKKLPINVEALGNPNKQYAIVRKPEFERPDVTIKDIFGSSDKPSYKTSYTCDFRGFETKGALVVPKLHSHPISSRTEKSHHH